MRIGWYAGCTALISVLGLAGFAGWIAPQWSLDFAQQEAVQRVLEVKRDGALEFPTIIEGTTLIAESLAVYEGNMIETGSDCFLVNAAALELRNTGNREILSTEIRLYFAGEEMTFYGTNIPAGAHILIVEQNGAEWTDASCTGYVGKVQYEYEPDSHQGLELLETDDTTLMLKNVSPDVKRDVWLYYKDYLSDSNIYIGGITYLVQIEKIDPGESVTISPHRYVRGYSKVVKLVVLG